MLNKLLSGIPLQANDLTEGFILVNQISKFEYKRYYPQISAYRMNNKTFEVTKNKLDMFSQPIISLNKLIEHYPHIVNPEPKKVYLEIKIQPFPENEPDLEVREIRNQLTSFLYSGTVTLNGIDYLVEVDKTIVNYISYFLYDQNEYLSFEKELNELLLQLCKDWNDSEYNRLLKRIEEINQYQKSSSAEKTMKYLDEVRFLFDEWFRKYNCDIPSSNNKSISINKMLKTESKKGKRINYNLLYRKYLEGNILLMEKNKKLPKQKELSKFMNCSESTISRMLNNKKDLTAISLLIFDVSGGKEQLPNFSTLDELEKDTLSVLTDYLARTKANLIQPNFRKR